MVLLVSFHPRIYPKVWEEFVSWSSSTVNGQLRRINRPGCSQTAAGRNALCSTRRWASHRGTHWGWQCCVLLWRGLRGAMWRPSCIHHLFTIRVTEMLFRSFYSCGGCHAYDCQEGWMFAHAGHCVYIHLMFKIGGGWVSHFTDEETGPWQLSTLSKFTHYVSQSEQREPVSQTTFLAELYPLQGERSLA